MNDNVTRFLFSGFSWTTYEVFVDEMGIDFGLTACYIKENIKYCGTIRDLINQYWGIELEIPSRYL